MYVNCADRHKSSLINVVNQFMDAHDIASPNSSIPKLKVMHGYG